MSLIGIDVSNFDDRIVFELVGSHKLIASAIGSKSAIVDKMKWHKTEILRLILGVEEKELTIERRRYAEAMMALVLGIDHPQAEPIWTQTPLWTPMNPRATKGPIAKSLLDLEFMDQFGMALGHWEEAVFMAAGLLDRSKRGLPSTQETCRCYVALKVFGFKRAEQFFCPR